MPSSKLQAKLPYCFNTAVHGKAVFVSLRNIYVMQLILLDSDCMQSLEYSGGQAYLC